MDATCAEQWRPIDGYEGRYEVSDTGQVRSFLGRAVPVRILHPGVDSHGYKIVALHKHGRQITQKVHVLVARAFIGPRPPAMDVMHLDGNSRNNLLANLEYGTRSRNLLDAVKHGTNFWAAKTHCPHGHEYTPENTYWQPGPRHRICRECGRRRERERHQRKRNQLTRV